MENLTFCIKDDKFVFIKSGIPVEYAEYGVVFIFNFNAITQYPIGVHVNGVYIDRNIGRGNL